MVTHGRDVTEKIGKGEIPKHVAPDCQGNKTCRQTSDPHGEVKGQRNLFGQMRVGGIIVSELLCEHVGEGQSA